MNLKVKAGSVSQIISGDVVNVSGSVRDKKQQIDAPVQNNANLTLAGQTPTRNSMRMLLSEILMSSVDLDAFCMDFFPDIYQLFSAGMQVEERRNLLLWRTRPEMILSCVRKLYPQQVKSKEHLLVYE